MRVRLPVVVASPSFLAQTSSLPATPVFTPVADGSFRVSAYITSPVPATTISVAIQWTDDFNSPPNQPTFSFSSGLGPTGNAGQGAVAIRAKAGTAITVLVSDPSSIEYNLYVTVEDL
jgi:hypothetical protein